jgi:hypothetical protein
MGGRTALEEIWAEIHDFTEAQNNRSKLRSNRRSISLTLLITLFVAIIISMDGWLWLLGCGALGLIYKILYDDDWTVSWWRKRRIPRFARRLDASMADTRTISQLEAEGYPWIGCECCKGTVWVPFKMLRERIPMLSAMTLDQLGARMRCDKCGKRPERYYPANQSDTPGFVRS